MNPFVNEPKLTFTNNLAELVGIKHIFRADDCHNGLSPKISHWQGVEVYGYCFWGSNLKFQGEELQFETLVVDGLVVLGLAF